MHMIPRQDCQLPPARSPPDGDVRTSTREPSFTREASLPARLCPVPTLAQLSKPGTPGMPWSPFSPFSRRKAGWAVWPWAQFPQML